MRGKQSSTRQEEERRINSSATRLSRWSLNPVLDLRWLPRSRRLWTIGGKLEFLEDERVDVGRFALCCAAHRKTLHEGNCCSPILVNISWMCSLAEVTKPGLLGGLLQVDQFNTCSRVRRSFSPTPVCACATHTDSSVLTF